MSRGEDALVFIWLSQPVAVTAFLESGPLRMAVWPFQSQLKMLVNGMVCYVHTYERHKLGGLIGRLNSSTGGKDCGRGKAVGHKPHKTFWKWMLFAYLGKPTFFFFFFLWKMLF